MGHHHHHHHHHAAHHHVPAYQASTHHHHHASGSFFSHLGSSYAWSVGGTNAAITLEAARRDAWEREQFERDQAARAQAARELAAQREQAARIELAGRIEALRSMHRVSMTPVVWESYRDAPDPGSEARADWERIRTLATRVLERDVLAYSEALAMCNCLVEIHAHVGQDGVRVGLDTTTAHVDLRAPLGDIVPRESSAAGAPLRTPGERLDVYQDYVCGLALRVGRELLAVLPIDDVTVDIWNVTAENDAPEDGSGYRDAAPRATNMRIASMLCVRAAMEAIAWPTADASQVVEVLAHEMNFSPTEGFFQVPHITRT